MSKQEFEPVTDEARAEREQIVRLCVERETERREAGATIDRLTKERDAAHVRERELIAGYERRLAKAYGERDDAYKDLDIMRAKRDKTVTSWLGELDSARAFTDANAENARAEIVRLMLAISDLTTERDDLRAEFNGAQDRVTELLQEVKAARGEREAALTRAAEAERLLSARASSKEIRDLEVEIAQLREQIINEPAHYRIAPPMYVEDKPDSEGVCHKIGCRGPSTIRPLYRVMRIEWDGLNGRNVPKAFQIVCADCAKAMLGMMSGATV